MSTTTFDYRMMEIALQQAEQAVSAGEVPVGAVVVIDTKIVGKGYNRTRSDQDPSAHAEVVALRAAAKHCANHRLNDATLYVTLEPCVMCAGALLQARIKQLVFGAYDDKFGAAGSLINIPQSPFMNHRCEIIAGVLRDQCAALLQQFFTAQR